VIVWPINTLLKLPILFSSSSETASYTITSPLGLFSQGTVSPTTDNIGFIEFTPTAEGTWIVRVSWSDGFEYSVEIYVVPEPRMLVAPTTLPVYLQAEASGLSIEADIIKPDNTVEQASVVDLGNGLYRVDLDAQSPGVYVVAWKFPDGLIRRSFVPIFEKTPEEIEHEKIMDMLYAVIGILTRPRVS